MIASAGDSVSIAAETVEIEGEMVRDRKVIGEGEPARRYFARAVPRIVGGIAGGDRFAAEYGAPGLIPTTVRNPQGEVTSPDPQEAELVASRILIDVLNKRASLLRRHAKPDRYVRMTGVELAAALAELNLTPTFLAFLWNTSQKRVLEWIEGIEDIPHPIRLFLALLAKDPSSVDLVEAITESVTVQRRSPGP